MDTPVYQGLVKIGPAPMLPVRIASEMDAHAKSPKFVQPLDRCSLIDALDLAVDRRIAAVGLPSRRGHIVAPSFRSSPELSVHSPVYGAVNTDPLAASAEILRNPARSIVAAPDPCGIRRNNSFGGAC